MSAPPPPLHVAVDANVLEARWGGIPKYVSRIVEGIAAGGDRVSLLANLRHFDPPEVGDAHAVGVRLKGRALWRAAAVPAWCALRRPDVYWAPEGVLPPRLRTPTVVTVHDLAPLLFPESKNPEHVEAYRTVHRESALRATRVICISQATADDVVRLWGVSRDVIRIAGAGVDDRFRPPPQGVAPRDRVVAEPYVLAVGSLEPRKGLDVLIEAAATRPGWRLVLAGSKAYRGDEIAAAADRVGAVRLEGLTDDELISVYAGAEVLAAPSLYEGFGITPLEAMACGTPVVIASEAGALEEISGEASVVAQERTPEAWLAGIEEARSRRDELRAAGLALAARHRWPQVAADTRAVFAEIARG